MGKRLIVCCDGTWNQPDERAGAAPCPTNVVKLAALVKPVADDGTEQRVFYHNGIGSRASGLRRSIEGATGLGITHVLEVGYRWLARSYCPGDELYFFGFSRGAYTARSLAGLVRNSGILRPENEDKLADAFALYRSRDGRKAPEAAAARLFRQTYAWEDETPVQCIGVWDTVGSLGVPNTVIQSVLKWFGYNREFHDTDLSRVVRYAFHAVAIDEQRKPFLPTLWTQTDEGRAAGQKLEQRWFAGCHSDVGGGNPEHGHSDDALKWMVDAAHEAGLEVRDPAAIVPPDFPAFAPDPMGKVTSSMTPFFKLFGSGVRTIRPPDAAGPTNEEIYPPAKERWRNMPGWRPPALIDYDRRFPGDL